MASSIFDVKPSVISRDLRGKFVCLFGLPKVGKTSLSAQFPKALLLGFEHGWNALAGVNAIDVTKWIDFKRYLRELEEDQAKEKFETIIIDTVGIAWDLCAQYICMQHGVKELGEIPWGEKICPSMVKAI